jgi:hypothetical protein
LDQTTNLPLKAELKMLFVIGPTLVPTYSGDITMDINISLTFSQYDQPLDIQLPAEAQTAKELSLQLL